MSEKRIKFKIITPEKTVYAEEVDYVGAQGVKGSFGVMPNHIPFMTTLDIDTAKVLKDGREEIFSIMGGVFQFKDNEAIILTEAAERGSDIDASRAKLAKERAEALKSSAQTEREIKKANMAIAKAMARLKAASKN